MKYSFVLPAYKATYFKEAIDSILLQTYQDFELIIVNDASPEDLDSIVKSYDDSRIRYYVNKENIGGKDLVAQWNHCISYANGEYLSLASDDDIYASGYLQEMNELVQKYPRVDVFRPRIQRINEFGNITFVEGYMKEYLTGLEYFYAWANSWIDSGIPFFLYRREALLNAGGFAHYPLAWFSDDATTLRLSSKGIVTSSKILFSMRYSGINITTKFNTYSILCAKIDATSKYYKEMNAYIDSYFTIDKNEIFLKKTLKTILPIFLRNRKVTPQWFQSSWVTVIRSFHKVLQLEFIPFKYALWQYMRYLLGLRK